MFVDIPLHPSTARLVILCIKPFSKHCDKKITIFVHMYVAMFTKINRNNFQSLDKHIIELNSYFRILNIFRGLKRKYYKINSGPTKLVLI